MTNPIQKAMHNKLKENLEPSHMEIINESYMHNVPKGAETHFKVVVISEKFDGLPLIKVSSAFYGFQLKKWNNLVKHIWLIFRFNADRGIKNFAYLVISMCC